MTLSRRKTQAQPDANGRPGRALAQQQGGGARVPLGGLAGAARIAGPDSAACPVAGGMPGAGDSTSRVTTGLLRFLAQRARRFARPLRPIMRATERHPVRAPGSPAECPPDSPPNSRGMRHLLRIGMALGAVVLVAACELPPQPDPAATEEQGPSAESRRIAAYYQNLQDRLLAQGLLRTDGGGPDVPFSRQKLVEDFLRIALYDEYVISGGRFVARQSQSYLRRWETPVRVQLVFGPSATPERIARDSAAVRDYVARLARVTRHDIRVTSGQGNMLVLFLDRDEQRSFGPTLRSMVPRIDPVTLDAVTNSPRNHFCAAFGLSDPEKNGAYEKAVILIKAEHPDLMRLGCIHEEIAQALGLVNDSPDARPSIFNDDDEFALLTTHDELLLRMLYDRRLRVGMTAQEALPIVEQIAAELMGDS